MPHIIIKMKSGRTEEQKNNIAQEVTKAVVASAGCAEAVVSVAIEEFSGEEWPEKVYRPDILEKLADLYKKPGYNPFA